jgi:hypothetical protein
MGLETDLRGCFVAPPASFFEPDPFPWLLGPALGAGGPNIDRQTRGRTYLCVLPRLISASGRACDVLGGKVVAGGSSRWKVVAGGTSRWNVVAGGSAGGNVVAGGSSGGNVVAGGSSGGSEVAGGSSGGSDVAGGSC